MNFKSVFKVSIFTFLSRILGLVRDILIARYLGASAVSDAFFVGLKIPNLFRRFFAEGTMQGAFIPIFSTVLHKNYTRALIFSRQIFTILFFSLIIFVLLGEIFAEYLVMAISPGFLNKGDDVFNLSVLLLRIMLPYLVFVSLASFYSSILNTLGRFSVAAFLPALLNIGMIIFLLLSNYFGDRSIMAAFGVSFGGVVQLLLITYICRRNKWLVGFGKIKPILKETRTFFKKVGPIVLGGGVYQVNILVDVIAASLLPFGVISYLFYADRVYQLPLAIIGIAIATVVLPIISNKIRFSEIQLNNIKERALLLASGFSIPATIGLLVFSKEIIKTIFAGGQFSESATEATSIILLIYAISLPSNIIIKVILPFFYAEGNTRTPFISTLICLGVNLVLVFLLSYYFGYVGIAFATVIASIVNFLILFMAMQRKHPMIFSSFFRVEFKKIIIINVIFLVVLIVLKYGFVTFFGNDLYLFRLAVILTIFFSILILILLLKVLKSSIYEEIFLILKKRG